MGPTNTTMPTFSKASQGLEGVPVWTFTTIKNMQEAISSYGEKLEASEASPYRIFRPVTTDDLLKIERARENGKIDRGVWMTHYMDWYILILKMPTAEHEDHTENSATNWLLEQRGWEKMSLTVLVQQHSNFLCV